MQTEINLSSHYQKDVIILLCGFSISNNHKPFQQITRPEIITFLDSFRKSEDKVQSDTLRSKQCPNCNEPDKPDSRFCAKCRTVLTYDAYSETIEEKQVKDKQIEEMMHKQEAV